MENSVLIVCEEKDFMIAKSSKKILDAILEKVYNGSIEICCMPIESCLDDEKVVQISKGILEDYSECKKIIIMIDSILDNNFADMFIDCDSRLKEKFIILDVNTIPIENKTYNGVRVYAPHGYGDDMKKCWQCYEIMVKKEILGILDRNNRKK
jgi:hypothetical protein